MVEPGSLVATAHWEGEWRSRGVMRQFEFVVDEPSEHGGTDSGPMPVEVFLASLATCFSLAVRFVARQRATELPDLDVNVRGDYRGPRIHRIIVEVASSHPAAELEEIVTAAIRNCWVSQTLAHTPEVEYKVANSHLASSARLDATTVASREQRSSERWRVRGGTAMARARELAERDI